MIYYDGTNFVTKSQKWNELGKQIFVKNYQDEMFRQEFCLSLPDRID